MVDVFFKKFGDPLKGADDGLNKSINETIAEITREAKQLAPVDTSQLRNSIMYDGPKGSGGHEGGPVINDKGGDKVGYVGTSVPHGVYQEFGTRYMPPQPFLRPAVAIIAGRSKEYVIRQINKSVNSFVKGQVSIVKF